MYPYIFTDTSLTVLINSKPNVVADTHPNFSKILDAIKTQNWLAIPDMIDIPAAVRRWAEGDLEVYDNEVRFQGEPLTNAATERLLTMMAQGFDVKPLVNFLNRVVNNPDARAVEGLYSWLERGNLPINSEGCIIAYKLIRDDYFDHYTRTLDHSVGKTIGMPRFKCDPNPDQTCSSGLHFCSAEYLPMYGSSDSRVVLVEIDPADVVAFPHDYNISKGRCCRYTVISEISRDTAASFFGGTAVYDVETPDEDEVGNSYDYSLALYPGHVEIFDEDMDRSFSVNERGIHDVAPWFTLEGDEGSPYLVGAKVEFDVLAFNIVDDQLTYRGQPLVEFTSFVEAELIGGLDPMAVPFPISNRTRSIRVIE